MPYLGRSTLADLIDLAYGENMRDDSDLVTKAGNRWIPCEEQASHAPRTSLFERLRDKSFTDVVLDIGLKLARALDHAHAQNIVHGDLKPTNVLLTHAGEPLLLDFNLSQDQAVSTELRGGTLPYMPPEHLLRVARKDDVSEQCDPRSDIYSFGALMFELLTGKPPLPLLPQMEDVAATAGEFHRAIEAGLAPIGDFGSNFGTRLSSLVMQCLSFDIRARPASAGEIIAQLEKEAHPLVRIRREVHSRRRLAISAVVVALTLVSAGATYLVTRPPRHEELFEQGLRRFAAGQYPGAAAAFESALDEDPSYASARFQLGRSLIELGELDTAIDEFSSLAREGNDIQSIANIGYCFNLKEMPVAAIPWYERALNEGAKSAAIYNNLGASYFISTSQLSPSEKVERAGALLRKALELDGSSVVIRINLIRLELARKGAEPSELPHDSVKHLEFILANASAEDLIKWSDILALYNSQLSEPPAPNTLLLNHRNRSGAFTERFGEKGGNVDSSHVGSHRPERMIVSRSFFIEPVLPAQPTAR
jgi:serine/threonine protein kinase